MPTIRWNLPLKSPPGSLSLAREAGRLLFRGQKQQLICLNRAGQTVAESSGTRDIVAWVISDDGSTILTAEEPNRICWRNPDLSLRREIRSLHRVQTVAVDSLGILAAVADERHRITLYDREGREFRTAECPLPIRHLLFCPTEAKLLAAADFGWVALLEIESGTWIWQQTPVSHIGSLAVAGSGEPILCACYSDGLNAYSREGKKLPLLSKASHFCGISLGGQQILATENEEVRWSTAQGETLFSHRLEATPTTIAVDATADAVYIATQDRLMLLTRT